MVFQSSREPEQRIGVVESVVAAFTQLFPQRVRACYALGSAADGSALATSDLDLTLIFAHAFMTPGEYDEAARLATDLTSRATVELDLTVTDERTLSAGVEPNLKFAATLLYGADIRDALPLMPIAEWTRDRMHSSWWRVARLFARPPIITPPLDYPEPEQEFLGYTRRTVRLVDGREVPCTRDLIRLIGWAATALLALDCRVYVASKREAHTLYYEHIGGPWDTLITETYEALRMRWAYLIPDDQQERGLLRNICERALPFERYFLARYISFLIAELQAEGDRALAACEVLRRAPLAEPAVVATLRELREGADAALQPMANAALAALDLGAEDDQANHFSYLIEGERLHARAGHWLRGARTRALLGAQPLVARHEALLRAGQWRYWRGGGECRARSKGLGSLRHLGRA